MESVKPKTKGNCNPVLEYSGPYKTSGQYADALRSWMFQIYQVQCIHSSFPLFLANLQAQNSPNTSGISPQTFNISAPRPNQPQAQPRTTNEEPPRQGEDFVIPPIWKRFIAESIDFFLFFLIKLLATYFVIDSLELLDDLDKYDLEELSMDFMSTYKLASSLSSELLVLELLHRVGTCLLEALCLERNFGILGGATPGKKLMGLKVVRCEYVTPSLGDRVTVYPSSYLGFSRAILRSFMKNLTLTFLLPICFTMFAFQNNRTVYDVVAGSIVVEANIPRRPRAPRI